MLIKNLEDFY